MITTWLMLSALVIPQQFGDNVLSEIDQRHKAGLIDAETRHYLRVATVKAPERLPEDLQASLARSKLDPAGMTGVLVEAVQWLARSGVQDSPVRQLLAPPADLAHTIESDTLPLRVSYDNTSYAAKAQRVLQGTETSWRVEIDDYGFTAPAIEPGSERLRIHIEDTGWGGGAYTAPYDWDPRSAWPRCYTYIVVDPANWSETLDATMAHELNHAMQAAMDCIETTPFWENTATYIMGKVFPSDWYQTVMTFSLFQEQPWRSLSYMDQWQSDGYEYGGSLLLVYLEDAYARDDGPVMARQIWEAGQQNNFEDNEPDYLDAMTEVLADRGQDSFGRFVTDFSESRFYVGSFSDDRHMRRAAAYDDAELQMAATYGSEELPVTDRRGPSSYAPEPYGSNHVVLDMWRAVDYPLQVRFKGDDGVRWGARVVLSHGGETLSQDLDFADRSSGALQVDPTGYRYLLLLVVNMGDGTFDPDQATVRTASYNYSIVAAAPVLEAVEPAEVEAGQEAQLRLVGSGFVDGEDFAVELPDGGLEVLSIDAVSLSEVKITVRAAKDTAAGAQTLVVRNPGGEQATRDDLLRVAAAKDDGDGGELELPDPLRAVGCECSGAGAPGLPWGLLALVALVSLRRWSGQPRR